jgi:membrane associated rhomboid family serine protease
MSLYSVEKRRIMEDVSLQTDPVVAPRSATPPLGNYAIMLAATCAFAAQMLFDPGAHYLSALVLQKWSLPGLFGHMWLHMTMVHLVGNLITLWIFGHYVCPKLGHVPYALAYIAAGLGAGVVHIAYDGRPVIGASGAIMGILGIYVVLCFEQFGRFGPWLILIWFLATLGAAIIGGSPEAYAAHLGGFLSGMMLATCVTFFRMATSGETTPAPSVLPEPSPARP